MEPEKIHIEKEDDLAQVSQKVFSADADQIILIVPKFSKLARSEDNFHFLKKGLDQAQKTLIVESVDDEVISLARRADLEAQNPFFNRSENNDAKPTDSIDVKNESFEEVGSNDYQKVSGPAPQLVADDVFNEVDQELKKAFKIQKPRRQFSKKPIFTSLVLILIVAAGAWASFKILPQANVQLTAQKSNWPFSGQVTIDKNAVASDLKNLKIPGQIFIQKRNATLAHAASGSKNLNQKAKGKLIIYNNFSSSPQSLVASTRFEAPDGKIFRLDKAVVVPGAQISNSKIVPSSIEVDATADQSGADFNIGPTPKLTIPGFKSTPEKYAGFYGEIKTPFKGGFVGERAYPTDADLQQAKEQSSKNLAASLQALLDSQVPQGFIILKDTPNFTITREEIDTEVNDKGEFTIYQEAELSVMGFRESDLIAALEIKMQEELGSDFTINSHKIDYSPASPEWSGNQMALKVDFSSIAQKPIDIFEVRRQIAGLSEASLKSLIYGIPGLESAKISFWPFWVNSVPENYSKIKINID